MNSYPQSYDYYTSSPSYCACCYPSTSYYPPQTSPAYAYSIPTSPFIPQPVQIPSPSSKITRLQYTNKDRYILNELFKRTPYPNGIQRDIIAQQLGITQDQIRIWFQNRRRLQTQRDTGERLATSNEISVLQQGRKCVNPNELKKLLDKVAQYKNAPPRLRLDESS